jgi:hypothetical protein
MTRRFLIIIVIAITLLAGNSFSKWELYGLKGKEITSLATGIFFGDTMLFAGTKSEGVFVQYKRADTFSLLTRAGTDTIVPALKSIHSLFMQTNPAVPVLCAGSDSGLYCYRFTSGLIPQWYKISGISSEPVMAISGRNDTLFAATRSEIYKNGTGMAAWEPCSARTFLPAMQRMSAFSSLCIFKGINAGSTMSAAMSSWWGVLYSQSWGKSWTDVSSMPAQSSPRMTSVFSLAVYAPDFSQPQQLAAGTSSGVFYATDFVTDIWHPCNPQLNIAPAKHLYVTYHTRSTIADIFASTDSGVCILSALVKSGEWVLSRAGKANAVISLTSMDTKEWFAATSDGVFRFTLGNVGAHASITGRVASFGNCTYLNGKPLCTGLLAPVAGCTVSVTRTTAVTPVTHYTAITDNAGNYSIDSIPIVGTNDTFHVTASAGPDHSKGSQDVILSDAQTKTVNFNLENSFSNVAIVTNDSLSFTIATEKKVYSPGDSIHVRYTVENRTTHAIRYSYTPGCQFDWIFTGIKGDTIYQYMKNKMCMTITYSDSILPQKTILSQFPGIVAASSMDSIVTVTAKTFSFGKSDASIDIHIQKPVTAITVPDPLVLQRISGNSLSLHAGKTLMLTLLKSERVSMSLYTLSGQKLAQFMSNRYLAAGEHSLDIAKAGIAEGVVIVRVSCETFSLTKAVHVRK